MSLRDTRVVVCPACFEDVRQGKLGDGTWVPLVALPLYVYDRESQSATAFPQNGRPVLVDHRPQCRVIVEARERAARLQPKLFDEGDVAQTVEPVPRHVDAGSIPAVAPTKDAGGAGTTSPTSLAADSLSTASGPDDSGEKPEPPIRKVSTVNVCSCSHDDDSHAPMSWGGDRTCLVPGCPCDRFET